MKRKTKMMAVAIAAVAILFTSSVKAQTNDDKSPWRLGFGVEGGIPVGSNIRGFSHSELGGTARLQYGIAKDVALTLTSGYYNLFARGELSDATDLGIVPVKVGAKFFFAQSLYFGAETGVGFETKYEKNTKFIYTPGIGWANKSWDVGVRYEGFAGQSDNYGFVALRLAYGFSL